MQRFIHGGVRSLCGLWCSDYDVDGWWGGMVRKEGVLHSCFLFFNLD